MWNSRDSSSNGATTPTQSSSGGFSGLLRSAGRKSSESLRRKLGGRNSEAASSRTSLNQDGYGYGDAPAVPSIPPQHQTERSHLTVNTANGNKPLPPGPASPARTSSSTDRPGIKKRSASTSSSTSRVPVPQYDGSEDDAARDQVDQVPPMLSESVIRALSRSNNVDDSSAPNSAGIRSGAPSPAPSDRSLTNSVGSKSGKKKKLGLGSLMSGSRSAASLGGIPQQPNGGYSTMSSANLVGAAAAAGAGAGAASQNSGRGDGNTIAQLYAVFGLPKDPSVWTLAEEDCVSGVHHIDGAVGRFWRPEVLGCSICPSPAEVLASEEAIAESNSAGGIANGPAGSRPDSRSGKGSKWEGRTSDGKKPVNPKFLEMADGMGGIEKAETARVLSKALKLSFTREIEIVSGQAAYPPMSTSHSFSFSVPTVRSGPSAGAPGVMGMSVQNKASTNGVGEGFQGAHGNSNNNPLNEEGGSSATFYGVVLTVWSAADEKRTRAIKRELQRAAKARALENRNSTATTKSKRGGTYGGESDANSAEDDGTGEGFSLLPANNSFFMPYAICIVSRFPIYNLLGDWNKAAWHKHSRNIEKHNQLMSTILRHPAPRIGETFSIQSPDEDVAFVCTFPGALDWGRAVLGIDFTMWPLFKTLSLDNILTICEHAIAPCGRVLFYSRHPALLGLAVETIKYLVEMRGWKGVSNQNCHARDVKIYLEDPGSWIIAVNTELRSIAKAAREVCVVDLDINFVNCSRPPQGVPSSKGLRERRRKRLQSAFGSLSPEYAPPREYVEAYPGGRFRPLSNISARTAHCPYDRLDPPIWWDQGTIVSAFDKALQETSRSSFMQKVIKRSAAKKNPQSQAELEAILALRRRASTFVDARDGLENKIGRLNKRLAFLMSESEMWKAQFEKIQQLVDRLTREATDLRGKVDRERRESRRLSSTLAQRDMEQVQLQIRIKETETAREKAKAELAKMQSAMEGVEAEREAMMDEIRNVLSGAGEDLAFLSRFSIMSEANSRSSSPAGSAMTHGSNLTPSQSADFIAKSRALAEQRLSMHKGGRSSAQDHTSNSGHSIRRSRSTDALAASKKEDDARSNSGNHFPDDQMNYEIQQRTSIVTSQISRIQQQLESTLTNLEGRRSGMYDRGARRRGSVSSISSRYEYGPPSSLGHHGGRDGATSAMSAMSVDGEKEVKTYEAIESISDSKANLEVNGNGNANGAPPKPRRTASSSSEVGPDRRAPMQPPVKSPARQKQPENAWKALANTPSKGSVGTGGSPTDTVNSNDAKLPAPSKGKTRAQEPLTSEGEISDGAAASVKPASPTQAPVSDSDGISS